jgi:flagellar basal-body rod protein FlgF
MSGSYYVALSGMRTRLGELDRLASDIANVSTAGYKAEHATTAQSDRPDFGAELSSAIDVADGATSIDFRAGAIVPTGRDLDLAIDGPGMFVVSTPDGDRYTRDGRFVRRTDGVLTTNDGHVVQGESGPIRLGKGPIKIDPDGSVRSGGALAGRLKVVEFDKPSALTRENTYMFRGDEAGPSPASESEVRSGALEQSNVSLVDRIASMTGTSRGFESLQRAIATMSNDVDGRAISELGRHG